jgi:hypothetical protein
MKTILISRTYATISPESAEHGEYEETGFLAEREEVTLRELVELLRGGRPSSSPSCGTPNEWVEYSHDTDYRTSTETIECVHLCREQVNANASRIWKWAFKLSGISR